MRGLLALGAAQSCGRWFIRLHSHPARNVQLAGVSPQVVERLRDKHHIYMTQDSRMNLAGIMPHNAANVADAIAAERLAKGPVSGS